MHGNLVITIGRECGSGGRFIGQKLAKRLGVKCYDKELLSLSAKNSGLCEEIFEHHDEKPTNSFLYSLVMDTYSMSYNPSGFVDMPLNQKVFLASFDAIKKSFWRSLIPSSSLQKRNPVSSSDGVPTMHWRIIPIRYQCLQPQPMRTRLNI